MAELQLEIELPEGKRLVVPLDRARTLRLGSHRHCEVPLPYEGVQPLHCGVRWHNDRYELIASKQVQTVELNGKAVASAPLALNDRFTIGSLRVRVVAPGASTLQLAPLDEAPIVSQATDKPHAAHDAGTGAATLPASPATGRTGPGDSQLGLAPLEDAKPTAAGQPAQPSSAKSPLSTPKAPEQELELAPLDEIEMKSVRQPLEPGGQAVAGRQPQSLAPPTPPAQPSASKGATLLPSAGPQWASSPTSTGTPKGGTAKGQPPQKMAPQQPTQESPQQEAEQRTRQPPASKPEALSKATATSKPASPGTAASPGEPVLPRKSQSVGKPAAPGGQSRPGATAPGRMGGTTSAIDALFEDALPADTDLAALSLDEPSTPAAAPGSSPTMQVGLDPLAVANRAVRESAIKPPSSRQERRRTGFWLGVAGSVLALFAAGGGGVWWVATRPSPEERLQAALAAYESGKLDEADRELGRYLEARPNAPDAPKLRVKRAVAQLKTLVDGRQWDKYLRVCDELLPNLPLELAERADVARLAELSLQSVDVLVGEAEQGEEAEAALDQALAASRLAARLPLNDEQQTQRLAAERRLAGVRRQVLGGKALREALEQLKQLSARPGDGDSYAVRRGLVQRYPELAARPELLVALREVADALAARVRFSEVSVQPVPKAEKPQATVTFASLGAVDGEAENVAVVFCEPHGTLYGLDPATGRLVWRRYVGAARLSAADASPPAELVYWDAAAGALVRLNTAQSKVVWESPLEGPAFRPVRHGDVWLVAQPSGRVLLFDHKKGTCQGALEFPQQLACEPGMDAKRGRAYVLAQDSHLYVVDLKSRRCTQTVYVGHAPGAAAWPPVSLSDRDLLLATDWGARLQIYRVQQDRFVPHAEHKLGGELTDTPLVVGKLLWLATPGEVSCYQIDGDGSEVLAIAGRFKLQAGSRASPALWRAAEGVWVAGTGFTLIEPPRAVANVAGAAELRAGRTMLPDYAALGPLAALRDGAMAVVTRPGGAGIEAVAVDASGQIRWQARLGVPLACAPVLDDERETLRAADVTGQVYSVRVASLSGDVVLHEPEMRLAEGDLPLEASVLGYEGGVWVAGWGRTLLSVAGRDVPRVQVELASPLVQPPLRWGERVVAILEGGAIWVADPKTLQAVASADLSAGGFQSRSWEFAAALSPDTLLLGAYNGTWLQCEWPTGGPPLLKTAELAGPPAWANPRLHWGPVAAGGGLAGVAGDVLFLAAPQGEVAWQYELSGRQPVGAAAAQGRLLVAFADGGVVELDAKSGAEQAAWRTGDRLAYGPLLTARGVVFATADGSLLFWQREKTR